MLSQPWQLNLLQGLIPMLLMEMTVTQVIQGLALVKMELEFPYTKLHQPFLWLWRVLIFPCII